MEAFQESYFPKEIVLEIAKCCDLPTCGILKQCCKYLNQNVKYITGEGFELYSPIVQIYESGCDKNDGESSTDERFQPICNCSCLDMISTYEDSDSEECSDDSECECECDACTRTKVHSSYGHSSIQCLNCGEFAKLPTEYQSYHYSENLCYWCTKCSLCFVVCKECLDEDTWTTYLCKIISHCGYDDKGNFWTDWTKTTPQENDDDCDSWEILAKPNSFSISELEWMPDGPNGGQGSEWICVNPNCMMSYSCSDK
jgi:hypothetical protein